MTLEGQLMKIMEINTLMKLPLNKSQYKFLTLESIYKRHAATETLASLALERAP